MTVAIIDGDVVAYMACENRFKNGQGYTIYQLEEVVFTPEEDAAYLTKAWLRFQEIVQDMCEICFTDQYKMAVKGENNFRNEIYPEYKANRHADPKKRNPFVPQLRQMAVDAGMAIAAHGVEADDLLRYWQQECVANGENYVICSIDKDLRCIPGRHYLMHKNEFLEMSEEASTRFYYEQLLKGDPTDNIKGIPKVGEVRAKKYLAALNTEAEFQHTVTEAYQGAFGNDWEKELLLNGMLLYLKKHPEDHFNLDGWNICEYIPEKEPVELVECDKPLYHDIPDKAAEPVKTWQELGNWTSEQIEAHKKEYGTVDAIGINEVNEATPVFPKVTEEVTLPVFSASWGKKKI
jgi:hypothetical protein